MKKIDAEKSLLFLLIAAASIVIYPVLGKVSLQADELQLINLAKQFATSGISSVFDGQGADFPNKFYAYLVSITMNLYSISDTYAVRLPSATVILALTAGMYHFRSRGENLSKAFLASLLFLSSYTVSSLAYHANAISIMALFFIFSLSALFHWVKVPSTKKAYLLIATTSCSSIFMGILAPAAVGTLGCIFLCLQDNKRPLRFIKVAIMPIISTALSFIIVMFLTNDIESSLNVLGISQVTSPLAEYGKLSIFLGQMFFSIFPWSVPIAIALFWIILNPSWLKHKFMALSLIRQFGVIVFIISIPTFIALNRLSLIMLLASIYLNMPTISSFLLSQIHNHSITWRITGGIFAALIGMLAVAFCIIRSGVEMSIACYSIDYQGGWSVWSIILLVGIVAAIYALSRNQRTIYLNNRYLYNIVILYLLAQILYKSYINPYLIAC